MSDNYISSGVKITASVDDLEKKLDYIMGKTSRTISKAQKEAGVHLSLTGQLLNKQGKLVEGLTLTQVKLGQYVDEMGKVRTVEDQYVADLNKIEQALGFYADELGNVYNKQGEYIRQTAAASRATEERLKAHNEEIEATQRASDAIAASLNGFSASFGQFATLIATLKGASGEIDGFSASLIKTSQIFSTASSAFGNVSGLIKSLKNAKKSGEILFQRLGQLSETANKNVGGLAGSVGKLSPAFAALGGPIGIATASVAALGAGIVTAVAMKSQTNLLSDSFKEIEKSAKKAGDSIRSVADALKYGAFQTPLTEYQAAAKRMEDAADALKRVQEQNKNTARSVSPFAEYGSDFGTMLSAQSDESSAMAEQKNAWAEYAGVVKQMLATAREEQKTEIQRLEEQRDAYQEIANYAFNCDELADNAEAFAIADKQVQILKNKIKEAQERELKAKEDALLKAQADARRSLGIDQYLLQPAKKAGLTLEAFDETVKEWREKAKELGIDEKELDDAIKRYKDAVDENTKSELARRLGVDFGSSGALSLNEKFIELRKAYSDGIVSAQANANALAQLQDERARELAEVSDSIKESKKVADAEEKRASALNRIADEYYAERISTEQFHSLRKKVESDFLETTKKFADERRQALERELGVSFDQGAAAKASEAFAKYSERLAKLQTARDNLEITQKQFDAGLSQLKDSAIAALPNLSNLMSSANQAATAEKEHAATLKEINEALEKRLIGEQDAARLRELANKREEERLENERKQKASSLGLDAFIAAGEKEKTAREKILEQYGKIRKAFREGLISQEQMSKARKSRTAQLKKLEQQEKEAARQAAAQRRQDMRSKLGIDSLMESLKSPLEKYRETMDEIQTALKSGAISQIERAALENKAAQEYWNALQDRREQSGASSRAKTELAKSVSAGSAELYLSQVKNQTANYQSRIQQTTENLYKTSQEALYQSQQTNYYLQELLANNGAVGVFG